MHTKQTDNSATVKGLRDILSPAFSYFSTCCEAHPNSPEETHRCWSPFWSSALWAVVSTYFEQKRWLSETVAEICLCKLCREAMFLLWEHLWISPGEGLSRLSTMCQWQLGFLVSRREVMLLSSIWLWHLLSFLDLHFPNLLVLYAMASTGKVDCVIYV